MSCQEQGQGSSSLPSPEALRQASAPLKGHPVSITALGDGAYLLADYQEMYVFVPALDAFVAISANKEAIGEYVPTDTAYDAATGRLYVANYTGNNVLAGTLNLETLTFEFETSIGDANTVSPEGVTIWEDHLGIANYDGGSVQVFSTGSAGATKICELEVPQAHGIQYAGSHLFATSLYERRVFKIDIEACSVVSKTEGGFGWERGKFLWPTAIAPYGDAGIIVADAHTGFMSVLSTDKLEVTEQWGGNGPGVDAFNMPYGVEVEDGQIWVSSTYDRTVAALGPAGVWMQEPDDWSWANEPFPAGSKLHEQNYEGYTHPEEFHVDGECYHPGYFRPTPCDGSDRRIADIEQLGYFVQISEYEHGHLISSPQAPLAYFYAAGLDKAVQIPTGFDAWVVEGELVGPEGPVRPELKELGVTAP